MPTYQFVCKDCNNPIDYKMSIAAYQEREGKDNDFFTCLACGSKNLMRVYDPPAIHL